MLHAGFLKYILNGHQRAKFKSSKLAVFEWDFQFLRNSNLLRMFLSQETKLLLRQHRLPAW